LAALLSANLPEFKIHHERTSFVSMGIDSPDASHSMLFNSAGNVDVVQAFWRRKIDRIVTETEHGYGETSHLLAKAGLFENIGPLAEIGDVFVVRLTRDPAATVRSFVLRHDFFNFGFTWIFYLDSRCPNVIVNPKPLLRFGEAGAAYWYICEMRARGEYYRMLLDDQPNVRFVDASLTDISDRAGAAMLLAELGATEQSKAPNVPGVKNAYQGPKLAKSMVADIDKMVNYATFDPAELARNYFDAGRRLGNGRPQERAKYQALKKAITRH